jgi:transposase
MMILALDLGKFNTMCCFFDSETRKPEFIVAETQREYLTKIFKLKTIDVVVMEACGPCGWISDLCEELGLKTFVCSTNEDAWKWANVKRKTDRDDALKLARLYILNELKPVHVPSKVHREFRLLVKNRKAIDYRITRTKNCIRSIFVNQGVSIARGSAAWSKEGRKHIDSFRKPMATCSPNEYWRGQLDSELSQLDSLVKQLENAEKPLVEIAKKDPRIIRLMTIPGVGRKTAEVIVAAIDTPDRFANCRQLSAYFGLVPKQFQSGETDRNGRITKRGSGLVRAILVECAWCSIRYNPWAKSVYERIHGNQKTRKKKAAIALARKLVVVAWAMLRDKKDWDPAVMAQVTSSYSGRERSAEIAPNASSVSAPKEETSIESPEHLEHAVATKPKKRSSGAKPVLAAQAKTSSRKAAIEVGAKRKRPTLVIETVPNNSENRTTGKKVIKPSRKAVAT